MAVAIRRLEAADDRSDFRSGNVDLDRFFKLYAGQNQFKHHVGVTYVAVEGDFIAGYATLTASEILPDRMPAISRTRRPLYPLPVLRLARLAVDERVHGQGVGGALVRFAFAMARQMADELGCVGVLVDAKPDAIAFYRGAGFEALAITEGPLGDRPRPTPMFIELAQIPAAT